MKIIIGTLLSILSVASYSAENDKYPLITEIVKLQEIDKSIENFANNYADELKRVNKISPDKLEGFISDYKSALLALYIDSYNQLNTNELKRLINFYKSEEGIWQKVIRGKVHGFYNKYYIPLQKDFNNRLVRLASENP